MNDMKNLLEETLEILADNGKTPSDVDYVTDGENYTTWDEFAIVANQEYDTGYGGAEVNLSLRIVGRHFWIERSEYDGSEWWSYKTQPRWPKTEGKILVFEDTINVKKAYTGE